MDVRFTVSRTKNLAEADQPDVLRQYVSQLRD